MTSQMKQYYDAIRDESILAIVSHSLQIFERFVTRFLRVERPPSIELSFYNLSELKQYVTRNHIFERSFGDIASFFRRAIQLQIPSNNYY